MPLIIPDAVRVSVLGNQADGPFASVFGIDSAPAVGAADARAIAQAVIDSYCTELCLHLTDTVTVTRATYVDLSSEAGETGEVLPTTPADAVGKVHVAPLSPQCTYLIKLLTTGGRSARSGRSFLPGVRSDEVNPRGDLTSSWTGTMTTAFEAFRAGIASGSGAVLGVIHRPSDGPASITEVTSTLCEPTIATQRRRLRR
jgi:hypothetical protein